MLSKLTATAPGSLMLLGEYAVLSGKTAIVAAIDKFITVSITPRHDNIITIDSTLGHYQTALDNISMVAPFQFILATLQSQTLPSGCDINITANFASDIGLGSSAAVTVATLMALYTWLGKTITDKNKLWHDSKKIITSVQGNGSGADLAASIYGGIIAFQHSPLTITPLTHDIPICAVYSGEKLTTARAIEMVNQQRQQNPEQYQQLDEQMDQLAQQAIVAIQQQNGALLGELLNQGQQLMVNFGVSNKTLATIVDRLQQQASIWGAKISGSGLGDCVVATGQLISPLFPRNQSDKTLGIRDLHIGVAQHGGAAIHA